MSNLLYAKLAATNLRNNKSTYFPYILTGLVCVVTFYIISTIAGNQGLDQVRGSAIVKSVFFLGTIVIGMFSAILLFYTNSFLIKRRKKELGLYCVLGMEKRHVARVLFFETLYTAVICLVLGLLLGILLGKLMFLLLLNILQYTTPVSFGISMAAISSTVTLFLILYGVTLLYNLVHMRLTNPVQLLQGAKQGEKEPKTSWILTILGVLCLGAGYCIAITVPSPLAAIFMFFFAVVLVICGTFFLFTAGSIALLKILKKNRKFYYQPKNFVSVSGMIYRMKQNAAGLASICILSTMVLVTLSTTVCLYIGKADAFTAMYPRDVIVQSYDDETATETAYEFLTLGDQLARENGVSISQPYAFRSASFMGLRSGSQFTQGKHDDFMSDAGCLVWLIPLSDYNEISGENEQLGPEEALILYSSSGGSGTYGEDTVTIGRSTYEVKRELDEMGPYENSNGSVQNSCFIILQNETAIQSAYRDATGDTLIAFNCEAGFNLKGDEQKKQAFTDAYGLALSTDFEHVGRVFRSELDQEWFALNGSFLYLGLFFGTLFLMATVLIIYYKQISEGFDDHDRFQIMQKVGMSQKEVRQTIRKQVLMVFFLPLAVSVCHVAAAFPAICKILLVFGIANKSLFFLCTASAILVFAVFYVFVYLLTARTYYRLVENEQ